MPIIEEQSSPHDEVNEELESRQLVIKTYPEVDLKLKSLFLHTCFRVKFPSLYH